MLLANIITMALFKSHALVHMAAALPALIVLHAKQNVYAFQGTTCQQNWP
jgi:hypothetical protein